jgi:hypothetical protein
VAGRPGGGEVLKGRVSGQGRKVREVSHRHRGKNRDDVELWVRILRRISCFGPQNHQRTNGPLTPALSHYEGERENRRQRVSNRRLMGRSRDDVGLWGKIRDAVERVLTGPLTNLS